VFLNRTVGGLRSRVGDASEKAPDKTSKIEVPGPPEKRKSFTLQNILPLFPFAYVLGFI